MNVAPDNSEAPTRAKVLHLARRERALPSASIPAIAELMQHKRWVLWKWAVYKGKRRKFPITPGDRSASVSDPGTWSSFDDCAAAFLRGMGEGLGFMLGDGWVGVDLDDCLGSDGSLDPRAQAIVARIDSYTEVSPRGEGLHVIAKGTLPPGRRKLTGAETGVEIYDSGRYFCVTGNVWTGTPTTIETRSAELAAVHAEVFGAAKGKGPEIFQDPGTAEHAAPVTDDASTTVAELVQAVPNKLVDEAQLPVNLTYAGTFERATLFPVFGAQRWCCLFRVTAPEQFAGAKVALFLVPPVERGRPRLARSSGFCRAYMVATRLRPPAREVALKMVPNDFLGGCAFEFRLRVVPHDREGVPYVGEQRYVVIRTLLRLTAGRPSCLEE